MNKHRLKTFIWIGAILLVLGLGMAAGGGVVYALTQNQTSVYDIGFESSAETEPGIVIASVIPDGPAAQAGVKRGDILLRVNDQAVNYVPELIDTLQMMAVGNQVDLTVLHGDDEQVFTVTLGESEGRPYLGLVPCGGLRRVMAFTTAETGAVIADVAADSPAAEAGLQPGDMITAIDGQVVDLEHSLADLIGEANPGDIVTLTVQQPGAEAREVTVQLGTNPDQPDKAYLGVRFRRVPHMGFLRGLPIQPGEPPFGGHHFALPEGEIQQGAVIYRVVEDSPAATAGLRQGDVLATIDGEPIERPQDLVEAVAAHQPGDTLTLTVTRLGEEGTQELTVTLTENPDEAGAAYLGVLLGGFFRVHRDVDGANIEKDLDLRFVEPGQWPDKLPFVFRFKLPPPGYDFDYEFDYPCDEGGCSGGSI